MKITIDEIMQEEKEICSNRDLGFYFLHGRPRGFW